MKTPDTVTASAVGDMTATSPFGNFYRWDEPESDITVLLKPETLERLQSEILHDIDFFSGTAGEAGGLLLGATERYQGRLLIIVDDLKPVCCHHPNGPFYTVSGDDSVVFEAAVTSSKSDRRRTPVGYYRSHNRDGLFLSADDLQLIQRHFLGPENVFLLIKPLANRTCTAGFFFWKGGGIQSEFTNSEVPLIPISGPLAHQGRRQTEVLGDRPSASATPAVPASEVRSELAALLGWRRRLIGGIVIASVATAVTIVVLRHRVPWPLQRSNKPEISLAVPLPQASALATGAPAPLRKPSAANIAAVPETRSRPARTGVASPARSKPILSIASPPRATPAAAAPVSPRPATPSAPPSVVAIAEPPLNNTVPPGPPAIPIAQSIPAIQPPVSDVRVAPPTEEPRAGAVPAAPPNSAAHPALRTRMGPQVLHQATPAVPRAVASRIAADVLIEVEAAIDSTGKVTSARVASTRGTGAELLTIEALKAAQLFRFQPAQENGRSVSSTIVLTFHFGTKSPINRE